MKMLTSFLMLTFCTSLFARETSNLVLSGKIDSRLRIEGAVIYKPAKQNLVCRTRTKVFDMQETGNSNYKLEMEMRKGTWGNCNYKADTILIHVVKKDIKRGQDARWFEYTIVLIEETSIVTKDFFLVQNITCKKDPQFSNPNFDCWNGLPYNEWATGYKSDDWHQMNVSELNSFEKENFDIELQSM